MDNDSDEAYLRDRVASLVILLREAEANLARVTAERDRLRAALEELEYRLDVYDNPEARELHRVAKSALSALP